jgi:hypothetical protein
VIIIYEPGDPVRLKGKRGLYRFAGYDIEDDWADTIEDLDELAAAETAEVIDPRREISRFVKVEELEYPGKDATPRDVAPHPGVRDLSERAHQRRK